MFADGEIVTGLLGIGVLVFALAGRGRLRRLPHPRLLLVALAVLLVGWIATVVEGVALPDFLNTLEHVCYVVGAITAAIWCVRATSPDRTAP